MSAVVKKGATDVTRYILLVDSAAGTPETAYTITALDLQYTRNRSAPAAKVDATALGATNSAHGDNQAIEVDATSSPGLYRVDWPDAAFATGVDKVLLVVSGTGLHPAVEEIQLVNYDPEDGVRLGLTALPNAAADAAGGLPISDAGGLDVDTQNANVTAIKAKTDNLPTDPADASDIATSFSGVNTKLDTIDDFLDTEVAAIKAKTDNLPTDPADASDIAASFTTVNTKLDTIDDFLDTEVAAIKAKTDNLPTDPADQSALEAAITAATVNLDATISSRATPAQVNTEVVDALNVDTYAEPGQGAPAATATLAAKLNYVYKAWRNKLTQTATTYSLYADDTTTVDQKATVSDDGTTFTKGEIATGP